jgi:hypothetical protein
MQFEYTAPQTPAEQMIGGHRHISAIGAIDPGDADRFEAFIEKSKPPPRTIIYIDSLGGHVETAMAIGRATRRSWFDTSVGNYRLEPTYGDALTVPRVFTPGKCLSAATLMFLGGRLRHLPEGSEFGVHQFSYKNPLPDQHERSQRLSASIAMYLEEMGIPAAFMDRSTQASSADLKVMNVTELKGLNVVTGGQTDVTWTIQALEKGLYVRGERDSIYGHHKVLIRYSRAEGFVFMAFVEAQGRNEELITFGFVEITLNGENECIDISDRCMRVETGIYVMIAAKISSEEARMLAYSASFGVRVRFSPDAPLFLGADSLSTEGGETMLQGFWSTLAPDG